MAATVKDLTVKNLTVKALTGNKAAAVGAALCKPDLIAAYPITPQSSVVETLASMIAMVKSILK